MPATCLTAHSDPGAHSNDTASLSPQENLQIYLKSTQGPIEVYLCPEEVQEPDSPAKEPLPSTSALSLSPSLDCAPDPDPGVSEPAASSGRGRRWAEWPQCPLWRLHLLDTSHLPVAGAQSSSHLCALHSPLWEARVYPCLNKKLVLCWGKRGSGFESQLCPLTSCVCSDT